MIKDTSFTPSKTQILPHQRRRYLSRAIEVSTNIFYDKSQYQNIHRRTTEKSKNKIS